MGGTFSVHFDCSEGHVTRFASALAFARKGQAKVLSVARAVLATVEHFTPSGDASLRCAHTVLGDIKTGLNFIYLPSEIKNFVHKCARVRKGPSGESGKRKWVWYVAEVASAVKKVLAVARDGFFKPMLLIARLVDLGKAGVGIGHTWCVLAGVKSAASIVKNVAKLYLGCQNVAKRLFMIAVEVMEIVLGILHLARVAVPPILFIVISVARSVAGITEIWMRTA